MEIEKKYRMELYTANGNLQMRWFVSYYIDGPNGKPKRMRTAGKANYAHTVQDRMDRLLKHKQNILLKLSRNYIPTKSIEPNIEEVITRVLQEKKQSLKKMSYRAYAYRTNNFLTWLKENDHYTLPVKSITKQHIQDFLMWLANKKIILKDKTVRYMSNRTINNHLEQVKAIFTYIIRRYDDMPEKNPCNPVDFLPSRSEKHVAYSEQQLELIKEKLHQTDPYLLLYCKFVIYSFMRPSEIRQMRVRDIDTIAWRITIPADNTKVNERKYKMIPEVFRADILKLNLNQYRGEYFVFTAKYRPDENQTCTNFFTKKYRKIKEQLKFSSLHTIYGMRHTYVCQLKRNGGSDRDIMALTGHSTEDAFYKYLRDIGALETKDLSKHYSNPL